ncbi:MAG TPA: HD domain-containing protein [Candidatus Angelobacter sp.]|jgi:hypothetical protein
MRHTGIERVQDSVHGLMEFEGMETSVVEVLRAEELQRLRRIRQTGLAHLVYPGAEHSRLVHSLGAAHIAIRFARRLQEATRTFLAPFLRPKQEAVRDIALAALCHDLGHGPLSHVWESEVIGQEFDQVKWAKTLGLSGEEGLPRKWQWHEMVGQALLAWPEGQLNRLLERAEEGTSTRIRKLLLKEYYLPYLPRLLSSDIDCDRCDFILRDAHQSGVSHGRYDLKWLISTSTVGRTANDQLVVGFDKRKAPSISEQFLTARRALYETVYYHKTVRSAQGMVGLLLKRLKEVTKEKGWFLSDQSFFSPFQKAIEGSPMEPREILQLDDYGLWGLIQHLTTKANVDVTIADLAKRIVGRDLFKIVPCEKQEKLRQFMENAENHLRMQDVVGKFCPGDPKYYIHVDHATFKMFCTDSAETSYFVDFAGRDRMAEPIRDHSLFRAYPLQTEETVRLFVPRETVDQIRVMIEP